MSHAHSPQSTQFRNLPSYTRWQQGSGVIAHQAETQERVVSLAKRLVEEGRVPDAAFVFEVLAAADRLTNAAMWLVVHMTYARRVRLDGSPLQQEDFKDSPQGHT